MRVVAPACAVVLLVASAACTQPSESPRAQPPSDLHIDVELDGDQVTSIAAQTLVVKPDLEDEHRRAWRLERFVPQVAAARQLVVEQSDGQRVVLPLGDEGVAVSQLALVVNRKGEVVLATLDEDDPFPAFHGRGGNRGRGAGEEWIRDLRWLRLRSRPSGRSGQQR